MRRTLLRGGLAAIASGLACLGLAAPSVSQAATGDGRVSLPSAVPYWEASYTDDGAASAAVTLSLRVYLAGRSAAAEGRFASAVSDPGSSLYGHYLTPARFRSRFGATAAQTAAVEAWLRSAGLTVTGATAHYVAATGTAPAVSSALDTTIDSYDDQSVLHAYAPDGGISVPASLGDDVATVTGLDGYLSPSSSSARSALPPRAATTAEPATAGAFACSQWWGQHVSAIPAADGRTSAPDGVCGYTPQQLRSAYGVKPDSGQGATIAIVLDGSLPSMLSDANRFFAAHHVPGFAPGQFTVNTGPGFTASCAGDTDLPEEPLDVETAHTLAPAARVVYVAADCTADGNQTGLLDAETRVVGQHLGNVSTESFSIREGEFTPATAAAWTLVFEQGAAEGIGFDFDSGDYGDTASEGGSSVLFPASDPWATAVGGTTLEIGRNGGVTGELGWGDNVAEEDATGTGYAQPSPPGNFSEGSTGGRSMLFPEPAYQRGVVPAALSTSGGALPPAREVPDIAADASPVTGLAIGYTPPGGTYGQVLVGGTSGASPIVAALEADAGPIAGHAIGFANPLLYDLRHSAGIRDILPSRSPALAFEPNCFADPAQPGPGCVFTLGPDDRLTEKPGYDDVTGIGAPTSEFITTVAAAAVRRAGM